MRAARFFIDAPLALGTQLELPTHISHHALRVLRLRNGDLIALFNGRGGEFAAQLKINGSRAIADIRAANTIERESPFSITLIQAWIATDKLDWVVEKSVELGVQSIVLMPALRSIVRLADDRLAKRLQRLRELIVAACAQCGRNRIPHIEASASLANALQSGRADGRSGVLLHPNAESPLALVPAADLRLAVAAGPEGGFDDDEIALAWQLGYRAYSLGPRVLRTETAGLAALATLQTVAGDYR
ncbi:MAG TPA: 16S rRNA (uracil(1498)-N(3))-methyltransferase [Burkholderiaceae bacterium]|nr:16S rRNA (uracil(1498)-N(3))-methyltransferase [Burkholderiaceae bacterium]